MLTRVLSCLFEISSTGPVELDVVCSSRITTPSTRPGMTMFLYSRTKSQHEAPVPIRQSQARRCCLIALPGIIIGKTKWLSAELTRSMLFAMSPMAIEFPLLDAVCQMYAGHPLGTQVSAPSCLFGVSPSTGSGAVCDQ